MRSSFAAGDGLPLMRTPSARQRAARRWLAIGGVVAGLVLTGALAGLVTAPRGVEVASANTGPFSYFPSD